MKTRILLFTFIFISCGKEPLFKNNTSSNSNRIIAPIAATSELIWNQKTSFGIKWMEAPALAEKSSFVLKFWDAKSGHFFGPYTHLKKSLCVFLWMSMPDGSEHGSAPVITQKLKDYYFIDDIYFIMPGNWKLIIRTVEEIGHCRNQISDPFLEEYIIEINPR